MEEEWTEGGEGENGDLVHSFSLTITADDASSSDDPSFQLTVAFGVSSISVKRPYARFRDVDATLRSTEEFGPRVEAVVALPSVDEARGDPSVLEHYLELLLAHLGEDMWQCTPLLHLLDNTMAQVDPPPPPSPCLHCITLNLLVLLSRVPATAQPSLRDSQLAVLRRKVRRHTPPRPHFQPHLITPRKTQHARPHTRRSLSCAGH